VPTFTYSAEGLALTKQFEGLRLTGYQDSGGVWTIGYGHTGSIVVAGMNISQADAEALLRGDLAAAVACVNREVTAEISQQQFDALVDFCFNVGRGNFLKSSLLRKVNLGDVAGAAAQFLLWVNAGGKKIEGLVRRRSAEQEMFLSTK
jgi:lysozyme